MKMLVAIITIGSLIFICQCQSKNDPTYSIHNYKQPNKAKEAKLIKKEGIDNEYYHNDVNNDSLNYKASNHELKPTGAEMVAIPVERNVNPLASNGHYKSAFGKDKTYVKTGGDEPASPVVQKDSSKVKNF